MSVGFWLTNGSFYPGWAMPKYLGYSAYCKGFVQTLSDSRMVSRRVTVPYVSYVLSHQVTNAIKYLLELHPHRFGYFRISCAEIAIALCGA
jgi:hypothetical protein